MSIFSTTKINQLLQSWPSGTVGLGMSLGVSAQLQQYYRDAGWLNGLGHGALTRAGDSVDWLGGLYAIQRQANLPIHVGARTALGLHGQAHYLEVNMQSAQLFAPATAKLPAWFRNHDWGVRLELHNTNFLPPDLGLVEVQHKLFTIKASGAARAMMECLYLAPEHFDLVEAFQVMEGLATLRPSSVQELLEECRSFKVKRLFLFMADKAGHTWFKHLEPSKVSLGEGKRSLAAGGVYVPQYLITVPRELASP